MKEIEDWTLFKASTEGKFLICRLRLKASTDVSASEASSLPIKRLSKAIVLSWPYEADDITGMPSQSDRDFMDELERRLEPLVDDQETSMLAVVATGGGLKEWVFYTSDGQVFMSRLNRELNDAPRFPIQIEIYDDPSWQNWDLFHGLLAR